MRAIITKAWDRINEQMSRLKLHLHINNQSSNSYNKKIKLKFVLIFGFVIATIGFMIIGFLVLQPSTTSSFFASNDQTSKSVAQELINTPVAEIKPVRVVFDLKSYVELVEPVQNPNKAGSVNIRETVCDSNIIGSANWRTIGQIVEGPFNQECLDGKWTWYKVKWANGAIGWSVDNYFEKIDAIRKFSVDGVELDYPFDWQVTTSRDTKGRLSQILLQKANSKLIFNTVSTSSIIGTIENNQPACVGDIIDISQKKESYRVNYGYQEVGLNKEKTGYYKYINTAEFFNRQNPSFETLYNKYLTQTRDTLNRTDTSKMPYIDLFDIQGCSKSITPEFGNINIAGNNQPLYIDLQIKSGVSSSQIIEEADKIVLSLKKVTAKTLD